MANLFVHPSWRYIFHYSTSPSSRFLDYSRPALILSLEQLFSSRGSHPVTMQGSITHPLHCPAYSLAFALWLFVRFRRPFTAVNNTLIVPNSFMAFGAFGAGFYSAFPALFARAVRVERTAAALNRARVRRCLADFGA